MSIPKTSISLLTAIAESHESPRWYEFYDSYHPLMSNFLQHRFPSLNVDDVIQDAMLAFIKKIPDYQYAPETKGHFHSYLLAIVRNKALEALRCNKRAPVPVPTLENDDIGTGMDEAIRRYRESNAESDEDFHTTCAELAVLRFLNDSSISIRDREIFKRVKQGESPESVDTAYGITRNNVDQIKARAIKKIRMIAEDIENIDG